MPRKHEYQAKIQKVGALVEEGYTTVAIAEILGHTKRHIEDLRRKYREGKRAGSIMFVPDVGSRIPKDGLAMLNWSADAYEEFFNRFAKPLKVYPHHRAILDELFAPGVRRLLLNVPPRHGKTRLLTVWFTIWLLCRDRNASVLQLSRTHDVALTFHREMAAHLQGNKDLIAMYGRFAPEKANAPGSLWRPNSGQIVIEGRNDERAGELSVRAAGAGQQVFGLGFDWILADDLVGDENSDTPFNRDKLGRWFDGVLMSRLTPAGKAIVIGTRFAPDDLYGRLQAKERQRGSGVKVWRHVNYPAVRQQRELPGTPVNDFIEGFPLWPEQWALNQREALKIVESGDDEFTSLEEIFAAQGSDVFSQMYQQVPIPDERRLVRPEWITGEDGHIGCRDPHRMYGPPQEKPRGMVRVLSLDPPQTNYGCLIACDVTPQRNEEPYGAILYEMWREKMDVSRIRDLLEKAAQTYQPDYLIMEINAAQRWFLQDPWAQEWARRFKVRILRHTTGQNKADPKLGFETMSREFEFGTIRIPDGGMDSRQMFMPLVSEVTEYPFFRTDDCAMSLWFTKLNSSRLVPTFPETPETNATARGIPKRLQHGFRWQRGKVNA